MSNKDNEVLMTPPMGGSSYHTKVESDTINHVKLAVGPQSHNIVCPYCSVKIRTRVDYTTTTHTHTMAWYFSFICCCCLPYCMESTRNTDHYCPRGDCSRYLGTYEK